MTAKENRMKNYLDEIYTLSEFKRDNPTLAEQAEQAKQYLKGYCPNSDNATFVVIEVEGYKCVAYLLDEFRPYTTNRRKTQWLTIFASPHTTRPRTSA